MALPHYLLICTSASIFLTIGDICKDYFVATPNICLSAHLKALFWRSREYLSEQKLNISKHYFDDRENFYIYAKNILSLYPILSYLHICKHCSKDRRKSKKIIMLLNAISAYLHIYWPCFDEWGITHVYANIIL